MSGGAAFYTCARWETTLSVISLLREWKAIFFVIHVQAYLVFLFWFFFPPLNECDICVEPLSWQSRVLITYTPTVHCCKVLHTHNKLLGWDTALSNPIGQDCFSTWLNGWLVYLAVSSSSYHTWLLISQPCTHDARLDWRVASSHDARLDWWAVRRQVEEVASLSNSNSCPLLLQDSLQWNKFSLSPGLTTSNYRWKA